METTHSRVPVDKLLIGVALIGFGILAFLGSIDVVIITDVGRLWPIFLIIIGVGNEIEAIRRRRAGGSWVLLAVGTWLLIGNLHIFGLNHSQALPVAAIVAGAMIALHAVIDRPARTRTESTSLDSQEIVHERQQ
jgi:uncharacterized membrane protein HdeD (DUF308 family)